MDEFSRPIISRADAKAKGAVRYFTGRMCVNGHAAERYTLSGVCVRCNSVYDGLSKPKKRRRTSGPRAEYREAFLEVFGDE